MKMEFLDKIKREKCSNICVAKVAPSFVVPLLFVFFFISNVYAQERYEFYNGVRSLGMGGAVVAVVNDETALIANPAALGKLRNYFITIVDPELDLSADAQNLMGTDVMMFMDPQDTLDALIQKPKRRLYQRAQVFPSIVVPNFGFGLFMKYETSAFLDESASTMTFNHTNDMAAVLGFNLRLFDGRIKIGANARAVNRVEVRRDDIAVTDTGLTIESMAKEGFGVATDLGVVLALPWTWIPTLAAVYRDFGTTSYTLSKGMNYSTAERPDRTPPTLDVGFALFPILGKKTRMTFTIEMKDVMNQLQPEPDFKDDSTRRLHGGIEFNFSDAFFIRGGMNQGYWTAGFELAMFNYQLQLATYGEEVGTTDSPLEERRYVGKFAWRF